MTAIPCALIRGGTSRGAYFLQSDLPVDEAERDRLLLRVMGGPDALQVDGIGGGHPLTSKVAIIKLSPDEDADVDYLFLQIDPTNQTVSRAQNCGNLLAGVGVYAIHNKLVAAVDGQTVIRVRMLNSGALCHLQLQTPGRVLQPTGQTAIDGVPGTASPIVCNYLDIAGSSCGDLLPSGRTVDVIDGIELTCIDNGMPVVVMRAADFGLQGTESPAELDANEGLKAQLESIRLQAGQLMNLSDVTDKSVPKMCLVSPAVNGGLVTTRTFIPHVCHQSVGVLGAVSVATACLMSGAPVNAIADIPPGNAKTVAVEHPSGSLQVQLVVDDDHQVIQAGVVRTARLLFIGEVLV
jgi:4-oxalomesaconate tautomerase